MKFAALATFLAVILGTVAAQHHGISHGHVHHKHAPAHPRSHVVTVYEFNGRLISTEEAIRGVKNGTFVYGPPSAPPSKVPKVKASAPPAPVLDKSPATAHKSKPKSKPKFESGSKSSVASKLPMSSNADAFDNGSTSGVDIEFPNGEIDCSTFPSQYGPMPVDWVGLGGWTGIQAGSSSQIDTIGSSTCLEGGCCSEGDYCSYACPPGYQKSQWPSIQGATGQSIGGIVCKGGKLYLTNPSLSKCLCIQGTNEVQVQVKNTMNQSAAICRTDYPGTEGETIPLNAKPGSISPLTCPDAANYYKWTGSSTSAQYYANPAGVPVSTACQWGSAGNPWGNFAPVNFGVGYSNGAAWLSIFQNLPTTFNTLDYNVELVGENGGYDNFIGRCRYINGQYCTGDDYSDCSPDKGCTVRVAYGTATYVLS